MEWLYLCTLPVFPTSLGSDSRADHGTISSKQNQHGRGRGSCLHDSSQNVLSVRAEYDFVGNGFLVLRRIPREVSTQVFGGFGMCLSYTP